MSQITMSLAGLGTAGYTSALVVIGYNFKQKRNLAMGLASSGESFKGS